MANLRLRSCGTHLNIGNCKIFKSISVDPAEQFREDVVLIIHFCGRSGWKATERHHFLENSGSALSHG